MDLSQAKEIQGFPDYFIFPDNRGVWSNKSKKFLASQLLKPLLINVFTYLTKGKQNV